MIGLPSVEKPCRNAIHQALGAEGQVAPPSERPNAFSLADPPTVTEILEAAGFAEVTFTDVQEPAYYCSDVAAAFDWVSGFSTTADVLKGPDPTATAGAVERLREVLAAHASGEGVWFNSRAWIVTARCCVELPGWSA